MLCTRYCERPVKLPSRLGGFFFFDFTCFLPAQVQLTDFENAAYVVFIVLLTRVILSYKMNFLIPLSKVGMMCADMIRKTLA